MRPFAARIGSTCRTVWLIFSPLDPVFSITSVTRIARGGPRRDFSSRFVCVPSQLVCQVVPSKYSRSGR